MGVNDGDFDCDFLSCFQSSSYFLFLYSPLSFSGWGYGYFFLLIAYNHFGEK